MFLLLAVLACGDPPTAPLPPDADGDGVPDEVDCAPTDPDIAPGLPDRCDAVDNDCDGRVDEDGARGTWWDDRDGDGWGDDATPVHACERPDHAAFVGGDCGPTDPAVHPGAAERCNGRDDDCDGTADESPIERITWYRDRDADGWGDDATAHPACDDPGEGWVPRGGDCADQLPEVHPDAVELCLPAGRDEDCDGVADEDGAAGGRDWYLDEDGDGFGAATPVWRCAAAEGDVSNGFDCDDADTWVHPGQPERCDRRDEDCDGEVDERAVDAAVWFTDADGDGYGDPGRGTAGCTAPAGTVVRGDDCDDADPEVHPNAVEDCALAVDLNCDGLVGATDHDGDGDAACVDCDDTRADVHADAHETCDGVDEDCDGGVDEGASGFGTWYPDLDRDGFGDPAMGRDGCRGPSGWIDQGRDCDDSRADVYPRAAEVCRDGVDSDCDGGLNDEDADGCIVWAGDLDGDGWAGTTACLCWKAGPFWERSAPDCDDRDPEVNPDAGDATCDGVDQDCDRADCEAALLLTVTTSVATPVARVSVTEPDRVWVGEPNRVGGRVARYATDGGDVGTGDRLTDITWTLNASAGQELLVDDLDGDGADDLLVSGPTVSDDLRGAGMVWYLPGVPAGDWAVEDLEQARWRGGLDDALGALAFTQDLDGDGAPEAWLATPLADGGARDAGEVALADLSQTGTTYASDAAVLIRGGDSYQGVGTAILGAGDVSGDGLDDLLVTADEDPGTATLDGALYVFEGPLSGTMDVSAATTTWIGAAADGGLGTELSPAGDVDGDGVGDVWVAGSARAHLLLRPGDGVGGTTEDSAAQVDLWAVRVPRLEGGLDVDGDGTPDLVVADETQPLVRLFLAPRAGALVATTTLLVDGPGYRTEVLSPLPGLLPSGRDTVGIGQETTHLLILDSTAW